MTNQAQGGGAHVRSASIEARLDALTNRTGYSAKVAFARPNNTTGYTALDVVGTGLGAAAGSALLQFTFAGMAPAGPNGAEFMITSTEFMHDVAALVSTEGAYNLALYSAPPATALLDNAAWDSIAADRNAFQDYFGIGTPVDIISTLYVRQDGFDKQVSIAPGQNSLWGYLITVPAYTPVGLEGYRVTLHGFVI